MSGVLSQWGMRCPKCGSSETIDIVALVSVRLVADGTDIMEARSGDHEWDDKSAASCGCGHYGTVGEFTAPDFEKALREAVEAVRQDELFHMIEEDVRNDLSDLLNPDGD